MHTLKWHLILLLLTLSSACSFAQVYYRISHTAGTQNINGVNVNVFPGGYTSNYQFCGTGPYWIAPDSGVGSYTFQFSPAVPNVRVWVTAMDSAEVVSFRVNGSPYYLTASNVSSFPGCNQGMVPINNGNLEALPDPYQYPGKGAEVRIHGNINSIEVHANWVNRAGVVFSMFWGGIATGSNTPVCAGDTLRLFSYPDSIPGAVYSWSGPSGFHAAVPNPLIPVTSEANGGIYVLTISMDTVTYTDSVHVTILPSPVTEIRYNDPVCAGSGLILWDTNASPGVRRSWAGPENFHDTSASPVIPDAQSVHAGRYTLTTEMGECSYTTDTVVQVFSNVRHEIAEALCRNEQYLFNGTWLDTPGTYYNALTTVNGCDSLVVLVLSVLPHPEISVSINREDRLCIGDTILLTATGADHYEWYNNGHFLGDGNTNSVYLSSLSAQVQVIGLGSNGCPDTANVMIPANVCCKLYMPDAFTPNRDGINDDFGPVLQPATNIFNYNINIFNRWGEKVFAAFDYNTHWDGIYRGQPAETGTYFYLLTAECPGGGKILRKGDVILIR